MGPILGGQTWPYSWPKGVTQQSSKAQIGGRGQWFDADGKPIAGRDNRFSGSTNVGADSFTKAQVTLKQGKASDAAGKRAAAVQQYKAGLGYLVKVLGTIRDIPANKKKRDNITLSFTQFADRVDELKKEMAARGEVEIPDE